MNQSFSVFRGEHGRKVLQSRLASLSFSDREETARLYAFQPNDRTHHHTVLHPKVINAQITIKNPILNTPTDPFLDFQVLSTVFDKDSLIKLAIRFSNYIHATNLWDESFSSHYTDVNHLLALEPERVNDLYMLAFPLLDDGEVISRLQQAGFDGAIHGGYGENSGEIEFKVFRLDQVFITGITNLLGTAEDTEFCRKEDGSHHTRPGVRLMYKSI